MKNRKVMITIIPVLLLVTLLCSGCQTILVTKNGEAETGETETRQYDFSDFTRVEISSAFSYEIMQSDTYSISITANNGLFDDIRVTKEGQTLDIGRRFPEIRWAINITTNPGPKAIITMPRLEALDISGATRGTVTGFSSSGEMEVMASGASRVELVKIAAGYATFDISGSSRVTGDIEAENMGLEVSGSSTVRLEGSAVTLATDVSGSSRLELADLKVRNADINLSGASDAIINLDGKLDAELSGASKLEYIGEPALGVMDITGASKLEKK